MDSLLAGGYWSVEVDPGVIVARFPMKGKAGIAEATPRTESAATSFILGGGIVRGRGSVDGMKDEHPEHAYTCLG